MNGWLDSAKQLMVDKPDGISPRLVVLRGGQLEGLFICADAPLLASVARMAVGGFEADEVILITDTYTSGPVNPEGKHWEHGEMQRRANEPAVRALLVDALIMLHARRGLDHVELVSCKYRRENGTLVWLDTYDSADDPKEHRVGGDLQKDLLAAVKQKPVLELGADLLNVDAEGMSYLFGIPLERMKAHARIAAVKAITRVGRAAGEHIAVAVALNAEADAELAKTLLDDSNMRVEIYPPGERPTL